MARVGDMSLEQLGGLLDQKLSTLATKEDIKLLTGKVEQIEQKNIALKVKIRSPKNPGENSK